MAAGGRSMKSFKPFKSFKSFNDFNGFNDFDDFNDLMDLLTYSFIVVMMIFASVCWISCSFFFLIPRAWIAASLGESASK